MKIDSVLRYFRQPPPFLSCLFSSVPSIVKEVLYFQRGQENVRNRTQVKLAATSLECKQAGRFSTLQYMLGGILFNEGES